MPAMKPPRRRLCILRLSAIGDVCHAIATVQAIQHQFPDDEITWLVGKTEAGLVSDLPGIRVVVFDKGKGLRAFPAVRRQLGGRFDVLLHMQLSLRANLLAAWVPARQKWGFPRHLSKELHSLVINRRVTMPARPHVLEGFQCFAHALGVPPFEPQWHIPIPETDQTWVEAHIPGDAPFVVVAPAASNPERNWLPERYAAVIEHLANRGITPVLTGAPATSELALAQKISELAKAQPINLVGQTNLKQLLMLVSRAAAVVAPDSGTAHMAVTQGTPVIGLYAHSNPERTGPYHSRSLTVEVYSANLLAQKSGRPEETRWGTRLKGAGLMADIQVDEVLKKLDQALGSGQAPPPGNNISS